MKTQTAILTVLVWISSLSVFAQLYAPEIKVQDTQGGIGIGTNAPDEKLHVRHGDLYLQNYEWDSDHSGNLKIGNSINSYGQISFYAPYRSLSTSIWQRKNERAMVFKNRGGSDGSSGGGGFLFEGTSWSGSTFKAMAIVAWSSGFRVGIGTQTPSHTFSVNGSTWCSGGSWVSSDAKLKKNIESYEKGLSIIKNLHPVKYELKEERDSVVVYKNKKPVGKKPRKYVSILAQELDDAAPELVDMFLDEDDEETLSINQTGLIFVLVNSVKELSAKVEEQQQLIEALQKTK